MTIGTQITRKALTVLATVAVAALAAPAALADPPQGHRAAAVQPDLVERWVDGRARTGHEALLQAGLLPLDAPAPDLVERWVDGRAGQPDLIERYVAIRRPVGFPDGYQPQVRTASFALPAATSVDEGFGWSDAGIGALAGFALTLVAGGALLAARGRGRVAHS